MFRFKQFTIRQDRSPMKVGTDGVLLGAWVGLQASDRRILDVGTGTGLIALMLAQRTSGVHITGVDVDDIAQARENAAASPWADRLTMVQGPVQEFEASEKFDLIVSNPPYFTESLTCPDQGRTTPRRQAKRVLMEFAHSDALAVDVQLSVSSELVIGTGTHEEYTPEYRALTRDFYLKF